VCAPLVDALGCGCGIYAASSVERLRIAGVSRGSVGVIGTVSMWGRVVEHAAGYRAEHGYPSRIRLVCPRCVAHGRLRPPDRVVRVGEALVPFCRHHAPAVEGAGSPAELEAEILSEYAVDLLPLEPLRRELARSRVPKPIGTFSAQVRSEVREFMGSGSGRVGLAVMLGLLLLSALHGHPADRPSGPEASAAPPARMLPLPGTGDPPRSRVREGALGVPREDLFPLAFVCGRVRGEVVRLVDCDRAAGGLFGAARFPPQPRPACALAGYSRRPSFSICWGRPSDFLNPPRHPAVWRLPGVGFDDVFRPPRA
jgi:hypothetical protein